MVFITEWRQLESVRMEGANKIFTMYLNTDPAGPIQQGGKWKLQLKNTLRNFESYLQKDSNKEELANFQQIKKKVRKFVESNEHNLGKGIILFATADDAVWFAKCVQMKIKTEVYWQETAQLDQLRILEETYPKSGIILVQQNKIKMLDTSWNRVQDKTYYELDMDTEDWRMMKGPRKGNSSTRSGEAHSQRENSHARYDANKQRWYKRIAPKLDKQAKDKGWQKIFVIGPAEASKELGSQMNKPIDRMIYKNMHDLDEAKVLNEVFGQK